MKALSPTIAGRLAYLAFVSASLAINAGAQLPFPKDSPLFDVIPEDRNYQRVQAAKNRVVVQNTNTLGGAQIDAVKKIEGDAIAMLFPKWDFYVIAYSFPQQPRQGSGAVLWTPGCVFFTMAISETGEERIVTGGGDYAAFGEFLRLNNIAIRNRMEATRVWDSFCETQRLAWGDQPCKLVDDGTANLGLDSHDQVISVVEGVKTIVTVNYYYEVLLDPKTRMVQTTKLRAERKNTRTEAGQ